MNYIVKMQKKKNLQIVHGHPCLFLGQSTIRNSFHWLLYSWPPRCHPHSILPPLFSSIPLISPFSKSLPGLVLRTSNSYSVLQNNLAPLRLLPQNLGLRLHWPIYCMLRAKHFHVTNVLRRFLCVLASFSQLWLYNTFFSPPLHHHSKFHRVSTYLSPSPSVVLKC